MQVRARRASLRREKHHVGVVSAVESEHPVVRGRVVREIPPDLFFWILALVLGLGPFLRVAHPVKRASVLDVGEAVVPGEEERRDGHGPRAGQLGAGRLSPRARDDEQDDQRHAGHRRHRLVVVAAPLQARAEERERGNDHDPERPERQQADGYGRHAADESEQRRIARSAPSRG